MKITQFQIIGWTDPTSIPLAKGADYLYVVDEEGVDGCTLPIYAKNACESDCEEETHL